MRQAVELPLQESLDAVEQVTGVLLHHGTDEEQLLARVTAVLVEMLDYAGALIAVEGEDNALYLRAFAFRAGVALDEPLANMFQAATQRATPLGRLDSGDESSLAVRAVQQSLSAATQTQIRASGESLASDSLFELLYPLLEEQEAVQWQEAAQVKRTLALPFVLPEELCGCLLIMSRRSDSTPSELRLLQTVAQQVALGIRNARLYCRMEEQRRVAQTFAHMAFSGSAYLHTLRNRIGALRTYLGLVQMLPHMKPQQRGEVITTSFKAMESLDQAAEILDHLHQPWRWQPDEDTDVNNCLTAALLKVFRGLAIKRDQGEVVSSHGTQIQWRMAPDLPAIHTSPEMLTEAFRIVIRNAADSLLARYGEDHLENSHVCVETGGEDAQQIVVTIADDGTGIAASDLRHIFELGWSTKKGEGMGFGLFWTRNFIEGLGGRIEVESAPQHGATFRIALPIAGAPSP